MRFKNFCLLVVILGSALSLFGQSKVDTVDVQHFQSEFLDTLLFNSVIENRFQNNLAKLFWSEEMMKIAKVHAMEMREKGALFYKEIKKGQCVLALEFQNMTLSYQDLANNIILRWLNSPGHKKLLLGEFFIYGATSSSFTIDENDLVSLKAVFYVSYAP